MLQPITLPRAPPQLVIKFQFRVLISLHISSPTIAVFMKYEYIWGFTALETFVYIVASTFSAVSPAIHNFAPDWNIFNWILHISFDSNASSIHRIESCTYPSILTLVPYIELSALIRLISRLRCFLLQLVGALLSKDREISKYTRGVSRQLLGKHVPAAIHTNTTMVSNRGTVFYMWSVPRCYNRDGLGQTVSCKIAQLKVRLWREGFMCDIWSV
jgi:hypothetical protein